MKLNTLVIQVCCRWEDIKDLNEYRTQNFTGNLQPNELFNKISKFGKRMMFQTKYYNKC